MKQELPEKGIFQLSTQSWSWRNNKLRWQSISNIGSFFFWANFGTSTKVLWAFSVSNKCIYDRSRWTPLLKVWKRRARLRWSRAEGVVRLVRLKRWIQWGKSTWDSLNKKRAWIKQQMIDAIVRYFNPELFEINLSHIDALVDLVFAWVEEFLSIIHLPFILLCIWEMEERGDIDLNLSWSPWSNCFHRLSETMQFLPVQNPGFEAWKYLQTE